MRNLSRSLGPQGGITITPVLNSDNNAGFIVCVSRPLKLVNAGPDPGRFSRSHNYPIATDHPDMDFAHEDRPLAESLVFVARDWVEVTVILKNNRLDKEKSVLPNH